MTKINKNENWFEMLFRSPWPTFEGVSDKVSSRLSNENKLKFLIETREKYLYTISNNSLLLSVAIKRMTSNPVHKLMQLFDDGIPKPFEKPKFIDAFDSEIKKYTMIVDSERKNNEVENFLKQSSKSSKGKTEKIIPSFESYFLQGYEKLTQKLIEKYKNKKPKVYAILIKTLIYHNFLNVNKRETPNKTELYESLVKSFGNFGILQAFSGAMNRVKEAEIEICRKELLLLNK